MGAAGRLARRPAAARLLALAGVPAVLGCVLLLIGGAGPSEGQGSAPPTIQSTTGVPVKTPGFLGPVTGGAPGETWAVGETALADVGGERVERNNVAARYTDAEGWQVYGPIKGQSGRTTTDFFPATPIAPGTMTPAGGAALMGQRPEAQYVVRQPGGPFQAVRPPASEPGVVLSGESVQGLDRALIGAADGGGRTSALVALGTGQGDTAIARWDGDTWKREPLVLAPDLQGPGVRVVTFAARGLGDAWALARISGSNRQRVALFRRTEAAGAASWTRVALPGTALLTSQAQTLGEVSPFPYPGRPLTITPRRLWLDVSVVRNGNDTAGTLLFDKTQGRVIATYCDAGADVGCERRFGWPLSRQFGYQSFAWDEGSALGSRAISFTPLPEGPAEPSSGAHLRFSGGDFERVLGEGITSRVPPAAGGAFSAVDEGWLGGANEMLRVTRSPRPDRLESWPQAVRRTLFAVTPEPGKPIAAQDSRALAVGERGTITRYEPGRGWVPEFLLNSSGARATPVLRAVAWPERNRAYAMGDRGEMWLWRGQTGLWERDPSKPLRFNANMLGVAFQPGSGTRGYAVGQRGTLLAYGKTWTQQALPAGVDPRAELAAVGFAGSQALVPFEGGLMVNDGGGFRLDESYAQVAPKFGIPTAVAGLPDGGAVVAGPNFAVVRDGAGAPWRLAPPLPETPVYAAAAIREGPRVRAMVVGAPGTFIGRDVDEQPGPGQPPAPTPPRPIPVDRATVLLRETSTGTWRDEQEHEMLRAGDADQPLVKDGIFALSIDPSGAQGWAVGGRTGRTNVQGASPITERVAQTSVVYRYPREAGDPPGIGTAPVPTPPGPARVAIGGGANCRGPCWHLANARIGADVGLGSVLPASGAVTRQAGGPSAFVYTGSRRFQGGAGFTRNEAQRYATVAGASGTPFFAAPGAGETAAGPGEFSAAFAGFPAPFGTGPAPRGVTPVEAAPASGARTHYAFDVAARGGSVRTIVIDNGPGSLGGPSTQVPSEDQLGWLTRVLADARRRGIPSIVIGHRELRQFGGNNSNSAQDGAAVARVLVAGGASAYFFTRPGENRVVRIPDVGGGETIPSYGTGTLSYPQQGSERFTESGYLIAEVDPTKADRRTGRAPVNARLIPLVDELAIDAIDGTFLRRSTPALFEGIGRRPPSGIPDRELAGSQYVTVPAPLCQFDCDQQLNPEYEFTSSDPDLIDFVRRDPSSNNPRDVFLDANDKAVTDSRSSLVCPFNAGTATLTVKTGGLSASTRVTVRPGAVQRPCGTRPLDPSRFRDRAPQAPAAPPPPPTGPAGTDPNPAAPPPPPPPAPAPAPVPPLLAATPPAPATPPLSPVPPPIPPAVALPAIVPPPQFPIARPLPPTGTAPVPVSQPVQAQQIQRQREEEKEAAFEEVQAASAFEPDRHVLPPEFWFGLALFAAIGGVGGIRAARGGRQRLAYARGERGAPYPPYKPQRRRR